MERRDLPSVDRLAADLGSWPLPRATIVKVARQVIDAARRGEHPNGDLHSVAREVLGRLVRSRPGSVLNATGVLLHTNLGRAVMSEDAARAAYEAATGYSNIEIDAETGERGNRAGYLHALLANLTGAEAALVVNNNAGALVLALAALARGRTVVVSRGELIEIGGAYRLPEIIAASGAKLREVGTTNRTRLSDYRSAMDDSTAALLKIHTSNYRIVGFTEEVETAELIALGRDAGVPVIFDAGSGLLDEKVPWLSGPPPAWLAGEPGIRQQVELGADLVMFSGDKLFGGPQAGVVVGKQQVVATAQRHPLARALRIDGPTIAAMTVTAEMYADGRGSAIPIWAMIAASYGALEARVMAVLEASGIDRAVVEESGSVIGAGSFPGVTISSPVIAISGRVDRIHHALLAGDPPVLARRDGGRLLIDLRAIPEGSDSLLAQALAAACRS
ncbi:MAG TPA: L-seryl-tRNA(Sec) selenium transferase [Acidimicrobiia bacterium]